MKGEVSGPRAPESQRSSRLTQYLGRLDRLVRKARLGKLEIGNNRQDAELVCWVVAYGSFELHVARTHPEAELREELQLEFFRNGRAKLRFPRPRRQADLTWAAACLRLQRALVTSGRAEIARLAVLKRVLGELVAWRDDSRKVRRERAAPAGRSRPSRRRR